MKREQAESALFSPEKTIKREKTKLKKSAINKKPDI